MDDKPPRYQAVMTEEQWDSRGLANQSAVFQISTNQRAGYGSRDNFGREAIFGSWDRVWVKSRTANLATRLSGNDITAAEMTTETGSEVKTHFISTILDFIQSL